MRIYVKTNMVDQCGIRELAPEAAYECAVCDGAFPWLRPRTPPDTLIATAHYALWLCGDGTLQKLCPVCDAKTWLAVMGASVPGTTTVLWLAESTEDRRRLTNWSGSMLLRESVEGVFSHPQAGTWRALESPWKFDGRVPCIKSETKQETEA